MKRKFVILAPVLVVLFGAAAAFGAEFREGAPSATVEMHATRVAVGIGITKGDGYIHYKGDNFKFKVSGLSAVGLGITTFNAQGEVYNLASLQDFPGTYYGLEGGGTFIQGMKGLVVKNSQGVIINLRADQSGLDLKLGDEGLKITPAWD